MKVKVYYHHTDCGGVVYYANYLQFLEEARTEFLTSAGVDLQQLGREGRFFVVARQEVDYKSPAFYADILDITTHVNKISGVRIDLNHQIKNKSGTIVIVARTVLAFVDRDFKPCPIPEQMQNKLQDQRG